MSERDLPFHLFGLISMTSALWMMLFAQLMLVVAAAAFCFMVPRSALVAKRLTLGNTVVLVASMGLSLLVVASGYVQTFAATGDDSERAATLATGITTVLNGILLAVPFAIVCGALLMVRVARNREAQRRGALPNAG
jgi:hypothetical protein